MTSFGLFNVSLLNYIQMSAKQLFIGCVTRPHAQRRVTQPKNSVLSRANLSLRCCENPAYSVSLVASISFTQLHKKNMHFRANLDREVILSSKNSFSPCPQRRQTEWLPPASPSTGRFPRITPRPQPACSPKPRPGSLWLKLTAIFLYRLKL